MDRPPTLRRSAGLMDDFGKGRTTADAGPEKKDPRTRMSWKKEVGKKEATDAELNVGRSNDVEEIVNPANVGINAKGTKEKAARKKKSKAEFHGTRKLIIILKNDTEQFVLFVDCLENFIM